MSTIPKANLSAVQEHPVEAAAHDAAQKLLALRFTTVRGQPDKADADALIGDVESLWRIFDPVIQALGTYAQETIGISAKAMGNLHVDQVRGALEGNLTCIIEHAQAENDAADRDDMSDADRRAEAFMMAEG